MLVSTRELAIGRGNRISFGAAAYMTVFLLAVSLPLSAAQVWAHDTFADGDPSNDWLKNLRNSDAETCCGKNDCLPMQPGALRLSPGNEFKVEIGGHWFSVPHSNLVRQSSPDGRAWVCPKWRTTAGGFSYRVEGVRCLILPPMI
jgi:hypothetical protein